MLSTVSWLGDSIGMGGGGEGEGDQPTFVPDQLMVEFEPGISDAQRDQILQDRGATIVKSFETVDWVLVELQGGSGDMLHVAEQWTADADVHLSEPNFITYAPAAVPNDPLYPAMWGLNNMGQSGGLPGADIDAQQAWDIFTGTNDAVVAVIDSGIYYGHPDLYDNMWINPGEIPANGLDDDGNGYVDDVYGISPVDTTTDPIDGFGHGSHVAGTIGAVGNNSVGVTGINWDVQLMAVKIFDAGGGGATTAVVVGAVDYVTMMKRDFGINIVVANASYGSYFFSQAEYDAVAALNSQDVLFVAAAGNDTNNNDALGAYPASYDLEGVLAVAATDHDDQLAWYSNYGPTAVDLAAPGGTLIANLPQADILSTVPPPELYDFFAGTSMASPHAAGVAALVRGYATTLSALETKQLLMDTVDPLASLSGRIVTGGRLNAFNALSALTPSYVAGTVWSDENANGVRDPGEQGIENWTVYVDLNKSGSLDAGEPTGVTAADGSYQLELRGALGTYTVAQVLQPNWTQTYPVGGTHNISLNAYGETITGINFGNRALRGGVSGVKWRDIDGDGIHDPDEPGMQGIYIYADLDDSGTIALGEPAAITDANGFYQIVGVPPGQWKIREVLNPGWAITFPAIGYQLVQIGANAITPNVDFGNAALNDFGDAPAPYPTLLADGGASHGLLPGFGLGALIDGEPDGIPTASANGDDITNLDDEDGITVDSPLFAGKANTIRVTVSTGAYSAGVLQGWIDFNADGDWTDAGEQVIRDLALGEGVHDVSIAVPVGAAVGSTFARFRYGYERGIGPTGAAMAGEVEDYEVLLLKDEPVAVDDHFEILQDSVADPLDVLANDFPSASGVLTIVAVTQPNRAQVTIAADGQTLLITPDAGIFSPPDEVFTYTIGDGTGKTSTADVTVFVRPTIVHPIAVDDAFRVAAGAGETPFDVLANDLPGVTGVMQLTSVGNPGSGTARIDDNGTPADPADDFIVYQPNATFDVLDQFQYTISNVNGASTATVTVFEDPAPADQDVAIFVEITDPSGNPISQVTVGDEFDLVVSVQDDRATLTPGIAAVYADLLYDRQLAIARPDPGNPLGFDITFSADYLNAKSGDASVPGIINEVGSFQTAGSPLGSGKLEVFRIAFLANAVGTVEFIGDPADVTPEHDVLYYNPPAAVPLAEINYGLASVDIVSGTTSAGGSGGSGEWNPLDVNDDGHVSPIDALLVVNWLNSSGGSALTGGGSGNLPDVRLDVNRDLVVSPLDALLVINYLNGIDPGGEGEAALLSLPAISPTASVMPDLLDAVTLPTAASFDGGLTQDTSIDASGKFCQPITELVSASEDWRLTVGQANQHAIAAQPDRVVEQPLDSLLDDIAEDILAAWLSAEDA